MVDLYAPNRAEITEVAKRARLRNTHPDARGWLLDKVRRPPNDWDSRSILSVPGLVWTTSSDTCMTGRTSAPDNVAYDDYGREFVFRQPANAAELAAIMSADSEEVFACYRFDGLERWTRLGVDAWLEDLNVVQGWIQSVESSCKESEITHPLTRYAEYLDSDAFRTYVTALKALLSGAR